MAIQPGSSSTQENLSTYHLHPPPDPPAILKTIYNTVLFYALMLDFYTSGQLDMIDWVAA